MRQRNGQTGAAMLPQREGSIVGQGPIETEGFNPKGQSPARRDTPEQLELELASTIRKTKRHLRSRLAEFIQSEVAA